MSDSTVKKRKRSRRRRKKILTLAAFIITTVALLCTLSLTVFFPVREVSVLGNAIYSEEEIVKKSGINKGDNLLLLSEDDVKLSLQKKLPFIDNVEISRSISGKVKIKVTETAEKYCYKIGDLYYSADSKGRVLNEYSEKPQGITFVDVNAEINSKTIRKIYFGNKENEKFVYNVLSLLEKTGIKTDNVNLINKFEITAVFDSKYTVNFGSSDYLKEKTAFFVEIVKSGRLNGESGKVDLSKYTPEKPNAYFDNGEK